MDDDGGESGAGSIRTASKRAEALIEAKRAERENERRAIAVARAGGIDPALAGLDDDDERDTPRGGMDGTPPTGPGLPGTITAPMPVSTTGAAGERRFDPSSMTTRDIRAIMAQDDGPGASAGALIEGLSKNVGKVLLERRREHDRVRASVGQLEKKLRDATAFVEELRRDCRELGADDFPDRMERMEPGKLREVSARPVFHKRTGLESKVDELESEREEAVRIRHEGERLKHMQRRVQEEVVEARRRTQDLEEARAEEASLATELERRELAAQEAMGEARTRLTKIRRDVAKEKALWMGEIKDRAHFLEQKKGFETFLQRQLDRHYQLEAKAQRKKEEKEREAHRQRTKASMLAHKSLASKLNASLSGAANEEARFEAALRKMGLRLSEMAPSLASKGTRSHVRRALHGKGKVAESDAAYFDTGPKAVTSSSVRVQLSEATLNPEAVLDAIRQQEHTRNELIRRRAMEEQRVQELQDMLTEAKSALAEAESEHRDPSAHRQRAAREGELGAAHKEAEARASQVIFLRSAVDPVRVGMQGMAQKLLTISPDLNEVGEIRAVTSALQSRATVMAEAIRRLQARAEGIADELDMHRERLKADVMEKGPESEMAGIVLPSVEAAVDAAFALARGSGGGGGGSGGSVLASPEMEGRQISAFNVRVQAESPRRVYLDSEEARREEKMLDRQRRRELEDAARLMASTIAPEASERASRQSGSRPDPFEETDGDHQMRLTKGMATSPMNGGRTQRSLPPTTPGPEGRLPLTEDVPLIGEEDDDIEDALLPTDAKGNALPFHPVNHAFRDGPPRLATSADMLAMYQTSIGRPRMGSVSSLPSVNSSADHTSLPPIDPTSSLPTPQELLGARQQSQSRKGNRKRMLAGGSGATSFGMAKSAVQRMRLAAAGEEGDAVFAREDIKTISANIINSQNKGNRRRKRTPPK